MRRAQQQARQRNLELVLAGLRAHSTSDDTSIIGYLIALKEYLVGDWELRFPSPDGARIFV